MGEGDECLATTLAPMQSQKKPKFHQRTKHILSCGVDAPHPANLGIMFSNGSRFRLLSPVPPQWEVGFRVTYTIFHVAFLRELGLFGFFLFFFCISQECTVRDSVLRERVCSYHYLGV